MIIQHMIPRVLFCRHYTNSYLNSVHVISGVVHLYLLAVITEAKNAHMKFSITGYKRSVRLVSKLEYGTLISAVQLPVISI